MTLWNTVYSMNGRLVAFLVGVAVATVFAAPILLATLRRPRRAEREAPLPIQGPAYRGIPDMAGALQQLALADLLQFLAQGGHTGTLRLDSGRRTGSIRLVQGLVTTAEFRRDRDLPALFQMLSLEIGDFHFRFEPTPPEPVRGREVVDILMLWLAGKEDFR
ncbi:MAG TPA: DUF4388 domain-containing protein [Fibrobacteria bacterium]|nr:DUF4388 domain-containing protein [Fibrobacteria bacterium]